MAKVDQILVSQFVVWIQETMETNHISWSETGEDQKVPFYISFCGSS